MTISSEVARIDYLGSGMAGPYPVPFKFLSDADILVVKTDTATGAATTLVITTDYVLVGAGDELGGVLTLTAPMPAGFRLSIIRDPDLLQLIDYIANDKFPAETHERGLDKLTTIVQRLMEIVLRSVRVPEGDVGQVVIPALAARAGRYLGFDGIGNVTVLDGTVVPPSLVSLSFLQAEAGAVARTALSKMQDVLHVADFGAVGDGATDDTAALQAAGAALVARGGGTLVFGHNKNYRVFGVSSIARFFDLRGLSGVALIGNGSTLVSAQVNPALWTGPVGYPVIDISGTNGVLIDRLNFTGGNTTTTAATGEQFLFWGLHGGVAPRNVMVQGCHIKKCQAGVGNSLTQDETRAKNISLLGCTFEQCFYPYRGYSVDGMIARYSTDNCGRDAFIMNPSSNMDFAIDSNSNVISSVVLIKIYCNVAMSQNWNTISDLRVHYKNRLVAQAHPVSMDIEQQAVANNGAGFFRNIEITFDVDYASNFNGRTFEMRKVMFGGAADVTGRGHIARNVMLRGNVTGMLNPSQGISVGTGPGNGSFWLAPDSIENFRLEDLNMIGTAAGAMIDIDGRAMLALQACTVNNVNLDGTLVLSNVVNDRIHIHATKASNIDRTDYDGEWVPIDTSGAGLVLTVTSARFSKHGRDIVYTADITFPVTASGALVQLGGLPFNVVAHGIGSIQGNVAAAIAIAVLNPVGQLGFWIPGVGAATNAQASTGQFRITIPCIIA